MSTAGGTLMQDALRLHQDKQFELAEQAYQAVLKQDPLHPDAIQLLGILHGEYGDWLKALEYFRQAVPLFPNDPKALLACGRALLNLDKPDEAALILQQAVRQFPEEPSARFNLALALDRLSLPQAAILELDLVIRQLPYHPEVLLARAKAKQHAGLEAGALADFGLVLQNDPANAVALNGHSIVLAGLNRLDDAKAGFLKLLSLNPSDADALNNLGLVMAKQGLAGDAISLYQRALTIDPERADVHFNLGLSLAALNQPEAALSAFSRTISLNQSFPDALYNQGNLLLSLWRHEEAVAAFDRLMDVAPDFPYAPGKQFYARQFCCDWTKYDEQCHGIRLGVEQGQAVITPFAHLTVARTPEEERRCADLYSVRFPPKPALRPTGLSEPHSPRIRIAYLSADFHEHATSFLMAGLFERHDRQRFEIMAVSFGPMGTGPMRQRLEAAFEHFLVVNDLDDESVARCLAEWGVDIAVDLKGYTTNARPGILAWRPAPVQVNYMGFAATTGLPFLDYILAD